MNAEFVQVTPEELEELARDPSSLAPLFHAQPSGSFDLLMSDAACARLERLASEKGANALLRLMESGGSSALPAPRPRLSLYKS